MSRSCIKYVIVNTSSLLFRVGGLIFYDSRIKQLRKPRLLTQIVQSTDKYGEHGEYFVHASTDDVS
jgi:hypothetical protein